MDKNREVPATGSNLISGEEFVRREPALAAVLADMALCAVRRAHVRDARLQERVKSAKGIG